MKPDAGSVVVLHGMLHEQLPHHDRRLIMPPSTHFNPHNTQLAPHYLACTFPDKVKKEVGVVEVHPERVIAGLVADLGFTGVSSSSCVVPHNIASQFCTHYCVRVTWTLYK